MKCPCERGRSDDEAIVVNVTSTAQRPVNEYGHPDGGKPVMEKSDWKDEGNPYCRHCGRKMWRYS